MYTVFPFNRTKWEFLAISRNKNLVIGMLYDNFNEFEMLSEIKKRRPTPRVLYFMTTFLELAGYPPTTTIILKFFK